jgi:hypothetical protein
MRFEPRCKAVTPIRTIKNKGNEKVLYVKARAEPMITGTMDPAKKGARRALIYRFIIRKPPPNPEAFGFIRNLYPMILEQILRLLAHTVFST